MALRVTQLSSKLYIKIVSLIMIVRQQIQRDHLFVHLSGSTIAKHCKCLQFSSEITDFNHSNYSPVNNRTWITQVTIPDDSSRA